MDNNLYIGCQILQGSFLNIASPLNFLLGTSSSLTTQLSQLYGIFSRHCCVTPTPNQHCTMSTQFNVAEFPGGPFRGEFPPPPKTGYFPPKKHCSLRSHNSSFPLINLNSASKHIILQETLAGIACSAYGSVLVQRIVQCLFSVWLSACSAYCSVLVQRIVQCLFSVLFTACSAYCSVLVQCLFSVLFSAFSAYCSVLVQRIVQCLFSVLFTACSAYCSVLVQCLFSVLFSACSAYCSVLV